MVAFINLNADMRVRDKKNGGIGPATKTLAGALALEKKRERVDPLARRARSDSEMVPR
jgi:hypothetical protein